MSLDENYYLGFVDYEIEVEVNKVYEDIDPAIQDFDNLPSSW